jgi:hypothetical protein
MKRFLIIGDSFVMKTDKLYELISINKLHTWTRLIEENVLNYNVIVDGQPSRDVQTIIDKWIISIPNLKQDDILIICLPAFHRTRLPLKKDNWYKFDVNGYKFVNKFIGAESKGNENIDGFDYLNEELIKMCQIFNSTESSHSNYLEIIDSLIKITPSYVYVFSWDNLNYENSNIEDRKILEKNINFWETLQDDYINSNGERGIFGDDHWSEKMNRMFYEYLLNDKLKNII